MEYTDAIDAKIGKHGEDIAVLKDWRDTVDETLGEIKDQQTTYRNEIIREIKNGHSTPAPAAAAPLTIKDLPVKWLVTIGGAILALLGGSAASVADLFTQQTP